jgi:5-methylcytosine-specific restriction endonuclease McrA
MRQRYEIPEPGQPFDPAIYRLGSPCKRSHLWDEGVTLRTIKDAKCPICARIDALDRARSRKQRDPEGYRAYRERTKDHRNEYRRRKAAEAGAKTRGSQELILLHAAIKRCGRIPSVARLVYQQQMKHWRAHPEERAEFIRQRGVRQARWRYMIDGSFRLYHRAKSKERKARERGSRTLHLSPDQMWRRWVEFGHCCAYCGAGGDLQVEHVIPISQGGEHHLGNIVPACSTCNYSKGTSPVREWYQAQPFFTEPRWLAILKALDRGQPTTEQLAITLSL